jgi:hypothetical protein
MDQKMLLYISIILNGIPGTNIACERGVRQGDPLSYLLFVAAAEILQVAISDAQHNNLIRLSINESYGHIFSFFNMKMAPC